MQRLARRWRRDGVRVGFVPTMGYLHDGHLDLVRRARRAAGPRGRVVLSIYVNPTQFAPGEDLAKYPRDLPRDLRRCRAAGVDVVFHPADAAMYPGHAAGRYSTYVVEERLGRGMEGGARPAHFRGVTTVVAKLFNLVLPDVAVFGAKDWQQAAVVRRMVADLNFPLRLLVAPTAREPDGLAMSSRNRHLTPAQRAQATVLWRALKELRARVRAARGGGVPVRELEAAVAALVAAQPEARLDYVAFFDGRTLEPADPVRSGTHAALAAFIGPTRLIDNARL
jgi:pantoate--beta-alanine ligase